MADNHRYAFDRSFKGHKALKFVCPGCGKKRFVRYWDFDKDEYLPEQFGKCDREDGCGHIETPWEYLKQKGQGDAGTKRAERGVKEPVERVRIAQVEQSIVKGTMRAYRANNLWLYLSEIFGEDATDRLFAKYFVGTAKGNATVFWQVDRYMRVRTGQKIHYKMDGHRDKTFGMPTRLFTVEDGYEPCLFGEHLIWESSKDAVIGLVESEKTAVIASMYYPTYGSREMIWLATTGMHGGYTEGKIEALRDRDVIMVPDFSFAARATWGMVPMRKMQKVNKNGRSVLVIAEEGEILTDYESYADKLRAVNATVKFLDGFEAYNDGSDIADLLLLNKPKSRLAEPEWDELLLKSIGTENNIEATSKETGVRVGVVSSELQEDDDIDRLIREKYGYRITSEEYSEHRRKIKGQMRILQAVNVQLLIQKFDLVPDLKI